jgi:hypothetical protein
VKAAVSSSVSVYTASDDMCVVSVGVRVLKDSGEVGSHMKPPSERCCEDAAQRGHGRNAEPRVVDSRA